jgi:NADPH:quinone reductase-like Zn-dependent oxidoreductase
MYLEIDKRDLHHVQPVDVPSRALGVGDVRFRLERFGMTANNVTYGVFGEAMKYWQFFPGSSDAWGRLPVWGFGTVVESRHAEVPVGQRVYGYWPLGSELVVAAGRLDGRSLVDVSPHRADLPSPYNRYIFTEFDPAYNASREDLQILLWPLFYTSFMVEDFLDDNANFGGTDVVISSASSKTSIGVAFLLRRRGATRVVGLTSAQHVAFVQSLGCYDEVRSYDELEALPVVSTTYVDVSGNRDVLLRLHHHFAEHLTYSMIVGDTHWDHENTVTLPPTGPTPTFLFAPVQIAKRTKDWGRDGLEARVGDAWHAFTEWCDGWLHVTTARGADDVTATYLAVLEGRVGPSDATVCELP